MEIKGLDKIVTEEEMDHLRDLKIQTQNHIATMMLNVMRRGGNIHGANWSAVDKRRKANRVARKQRRVNRNGS